MSFGYVGSEIASTFIVLYIFVALTGAFVVYLYLQKQDEHLPPGPQPFPIVGNVLQFYKKPYIKFMEWSDQYGPIFRVKILSET